MNNTCEPTTDEAWMQQALVEAERAASNNEVPVGALIVRNDEVLASGANQPIGACDPSAHAEIVALREAAQCVGNYRLADATLYVTLEPCPMCIGAIIHARIARLVYGACDPKTGAAGSVFDLATAPEHNHRLVVTSGVLGDRCGDTLRSFFRARRARNTS